MCTGGADVEPNIREKPGFSVQRRMHDVYKKERKSAPLHELCRGVLCFYEEPFPAIRNFFEILWKGKEIYGKIETDFEFTVGGTGKLCQM